MKNGVKIAIIVLLAVAVAATFALRSGKRAEDGAAPAPAPVQSAAVTATATAEPVPAKAAAIPAPRALAAAVNPRLLEVGSSRCMSCIEMAKVLDALRASQGAKLKVDFVDAFEQPEAVERYKVSLIPTQIFYDATGKEIFRHTGYFAHDDILAKFRELGVKI
jgi:thioredoxin 1